MATLFSDDFNRPDGGLGDDWEITRGSGGSIVSQRLEWMPGNGHGARVNPAKVVFPADQWAEATIHLPGSSWTGIGVRVQANPGLGEQLGYFFWVEASGGDVLLVGWGTDTYTLDSVSMPGRWLGGERLRIEAIDEYDGAIFLGVRVNGYIDGEPALTALHTGPTAWRTGTPGYNNYAESGRGLDDFEAGDFSGGGTSIDANTQSIILAAHPSEVVIDRAIAAGAQAITLQSHGAMVRADIDTDISAALESLQLATHTAVISAQKDTSISAGVEGVGLRTYPADLSLTLNARTEQITLGTFLAAISRDAEIAGALESIGVSAAPASISVGSAIAAGTEAIALLTGPAAVRLDSAVSATRQAIILSELAAAISLSEHVDAALQSLSVTTHGATITLSNGITADLAALTLTAFDAIVTAPVTEITALGLEYTLNGDRLHFTLPVNRIHFSFRG